MSISIRVRFENVRLRSSRCRLTALRSRPTVRLVGSFGHSEEPVQRSVGKLGLSFEVYCTVKLSLPTKDNLDTFEQSVQRWPEVVQCATVTGAADYELRIVTRDMHAFDDFLRDKILSLGLVSNIESRIVIRSVKNTTAAPLGLVSPYVSAQG